MRTVFVEPFKYAPDFIKKIAKRRKVSPIAYGLFEMSLFNKTPELEEERLNEMIPAIRGLSGNESFCMYTYKGSQLNKFGWNRAGASLIKDYRIVFS